MGEVAGTFLSVSAGGPQACGIDATKQAVCWGGGDSAPEGTFLAVSAREHTCGLRTDYTLACWGGAPTPPDGTFLEVSSGFDRSCGVRTDKTLACWSN